MEPPKPVLRMKALSGSPSENVAVDLRAQLADGMIIGELPRVADIAAHDVAFGTAQRALA